MDMDADINVVPKETKQPDDKIMKNFILFFLLLFSYDNYTFCFLNI